MSLILGVDPGLTRCGLGLIESSAGRKVQFRSVEVLESGKSEDTATRIHGIGRQLAEYLDRVNPDSIALERVFSQQNLSSVMGTAQISGVVFYLATQRGIPIALHTPTEVKAAVTGSGRANKAQVGTMVAKILGLSEMPRPADAADSLAIAICHAWRGSVDVGSRADTPAQIAWRRAAEASQKSRRV